MDAIVGFLVNDFLTQPALLIGCLILVGYLLRHAGVVKAVTGTIGAMVGIQLIIFGGAQFSATFKPITDAVSKAAGVQGYIMDSYAMKAASQEALGSAFGWMGYVFIIAFAVNVALVALGRWTRARGVFLTGNAGTAHSQAMLWLVMANFALPSVATIVLSGVIVGVYWAYSTTLAAGVVDEVTDGSGFTVGHNQQVGIWLFGKLAPHLAGKRRIDCESLELPGWLSIFNNNVTSVCLLMLVFVSAFTLPTIGPAGLTELAKGGSWIVYLLMVGIQFSMYMVILLQGVRMLCSELTESFQGIQQRLVPNAVPAIDVAALLPFSPNAATIGFLFTTLGTVLAMGLLALFHSPVMVLPGFTPLFFSGGPIGVVANKRGGLRAVIVCCVVLGLVQTFGTVWALSQLNYPGAVGWSGMFDLSTVWPAAVSLLRLVASPLGIVL